MCRPPGRGQPETPTRTSTPPNPVSTTFCLPTFATSPTALGVAATIDEGPAVSGDPGHPALGRSVVCIAGLGQSCGAEGTYTPYDFGTASPVQFVFRISAAALAKGDKITKVFHNGVPLPSCPSTNANGCVVSITPPTTSTRTRPWRAALDEQGDLDDRRDGADERILDVVRRLEPYAGAVSTRSRCRSTVPRMTTPPFRSARARAAS